jgi:hypothetical protein
MLVINMAGAIDGRQKACKGAKPHGWQLLPRAIVNGGRRTVLIDRRRRSRCLQFRVSLETARTNTRVSQGMGNGVVEMNQQGKVEGGKVGC